MSARPFCRERECVRGTRWPTLLARAGRSGISEEEKRIIRRFDSALLLLCARMRLFSGRVLGGGKLFRLRMPVRCWTRFLRVGHSACSSAQLRKPSVFVAALRCLKLRPFQSVLLYSLRIFSALPFIVVCIFYCLLGAKKTFLHVKGGFAAICTILEGFIL